MSRKSRSRVSAEAGIQVGGLTPVSTGPHGLVTADSATNLSLILNYNSDTNLLIDTTKPGWLIRLNDLNNDRFAIYRAAATASAPSWTLMGHISSNGSLNMVNQVSAFSGAHVLSNKADTDEVVAGDLSGTLAAPIVEQASGTFDFKAGVASAYLGDIDTAKWVARLGGFRWRLASDHGDTSTLGTGDTSYAGRTFRPKMEMDPTGVLYLATGARFGTGGYVNSASADNALLRSNYNPANDRLINTAISSWAVAAGDAADRFVVYRAAATASAPTYSVLGTISSAGALNTAGAITENGVAVVKTNDTRVTADQSGTASIRTVGTGAQAAAPGAVLSVYRDIQMRQGLVTSSTSNAPVALGELRTDAPVVGASTPPAAWAFYFDPADYAISGRTTKLRLRVHIEKNAVSPNVDIVCTMVQLGSTSSFFAGASGTDPVISTNIPPPLTGATVTLDQTPGSASGAAVATGSDFDVPTADWYILCMDMSASAAANSRFHIRCILQQRWV